MKASDLEEVTDLLKALKVLDCLAENDYSWFVSCRLAVHERPQPPHPMLSRRERSNEGEGCPGRAESLPTVPGVPSG